jgi:hypothetical protein
MVARRTGLREREVRAVAGSLNDVAEVLASDLLDGKWAMLWNDEQRGIGELMTKSHVALAAGDGHVSG